ncbi:hypothetical protein [Fusobacterium varium]|uniref:hypothetical protein n=1 Tax=Fusobacterium varium TaxID=856 RepID=UPI000E418162|nr:hypothetical protein [Fusobacterium varium]MCI6033702.1 hypothetical protein [Fusobacterium varium]RGJ31556.1 hypothetical protein DXD66_01555 [Fusobacterium varium]
MEHIKKIIENELKNLEVDDRILFRKTSLKTFEYLVNNLEKRMEDFEAKILDSTISQEDNMNIVTMIVPKDDFYLYEERFSPVLPSDEIDKKLLEILDTEEKIYKKIVLNADRDKFLGLEEIEINGTAHIEEKEYSFTFKLEKDNEYMEKVKEIYEVFGLNGMKWKTLNVPYFNKIFKLKIKDYDREILEVLKKVDKNIEIVIEKNELERYWMEDYILVWNILRMSIMGNGEIQPTKDRIHYEHTLFFNDIRNIYLCPDKDIYIYYIQRIGTGFRIVTDENREMKWEFIKISDVDEKVCEKKLGLPVFSNRMNLSFINKIKMENDIRLRNLGEIKRIVNSFTDVTSRIELINVEVTDHEKKYVATIDLNPFMIDEFKLKGENSNIYLYFRELKRDVYIKEIMDFIISELQIYFPEYRCRGVLI